MAVNNGQDIAALLITPIQRIPRYVMLLNELKKFSTPEHRDHATLLDAIQSVKVVADAVNAYIAARAASRAGAPTRHLCPTQQLHLRGQPQRLYSDVTCHLCRPAAGQVTCLERLKNIRRRWRATHTMRRCSLIALSHCSRRKKRHSPRLHWLTLSKWCGRPRKLVSLGTPTRRPCCPPNPTQPQPQPQPQPDILQSYKAAVSCQTWPPV